MTVTLEVTVTCRDCAGFLLLPHLSYLDIPVRRFQRNYIPAAIQLVDRVNLFFVFVESLRYFGEIGTYLVFLTSASPLAANPNSCINRRFRVGGEGNKHVTA